MQENDDEIGMKQKCTHQNSEQELEVDGSAKKTKIIVELTGQVNEIEKKAKRNKYVLEVTIKQTNDCKIELPVTLDATSLNLRLKSVLRGDIGPKYHLKGSCIVDNMADSRRILLSLGQMHTYQFDLDQHYNLSDDIYTLDCQLSLISKQLHIISNENKLTFCVRRSKAASENATDTFTQDIINTNLLDSSITQITQN